MINNTHIPTLENPEPVSLPIAINIIIDNSKEFDLPLDVKSLFRMSLYDTDSMPPKERYLGKRSISEKRAFTLPPIVFKSNSGIVYNDILIKGGGAEMSPNSLLHDQEAYEQWKVVNIPRKYGDNLVRYHYKKIQGLTDYLGIQNNSDGLTDNYTSKYLAEKGLRTRELIAMGSLPEDAKMSTPEGIITAKEFKTKTDVTPGLEAWAMRCKFRMQDISRLIFEISEIPEAEEQQFPLSIAGIPKMRTKYIGDKEYPYHQFVTGEFNQQQLGFIQRHLTDLAKAINTRARFDEDGRFVELNNMHPDISDLEDAQSFYNDYLQIFPEVLGEQFAIMDLSDAISGMSNPQNISMLAELIDHDVTIINNKSMDEKGELVEITEATKELYELQPSLEDNFIIQMRSGYFFLQRMIADLNKTGMINYSDNQLISVLRNYLTSYYNKLSTNSNKLSSRIEDINTQELFITETPLNDPTGTELKDILGINWRQTYLELIREIRSKYKQRTA